MKVVHVNFSGSRGGASIAARRLHTALLKNGVDVEFWCARDPGDEPRVHVLQSAFRQKVNSAENIFVQKLMRMFGYKEERSINIFPNRLIDKINLSDADIVHLHWINAEMIQVEQLAKLKKPVVWTFHDMWPFCGAEHYTNDLRYETGYLKKRNNDIDRWMFKRKLRAWNRLNVHVVCPSNWLSSCVKKSVLFHSCPVSVVPNCLDITRFQPKTKVLRKKNREDFGIPEGKRVLLFGAVNAKDFRKGGDLVAEALALLSDKEKYVVAIFGSGEFYQLGGLETVCVGTVSGDAAMEKLYSCADVFCMSSRQDNLPNTIVEALSCGVPVVGFAIGGLPDLIDDKENGRLVAPFDTKSFADSIEWVFSDEQGASRLEVLRENARKKAEQCFSPDDVVEKYQHVYRQVNMNKSKRFDGK